MAGEHPETTPRTCGGSRGCFPPRLRERVGKRVGSEVFAAPDPITSEHLAGSTPGLLLPSLRDGVYLLHRS